MASVLGKQTIRLKGEDAGLWEKALRAQTPRYQKQSCPNTGLWSALECDLINHSINSRCTILPKREGQYVITLKKKVHTNMSRIAKGNVYLQKLLGNLYVVTDHIVANVINFKVK